ncbi:hypothetical protein HPB47_022155 [Ixodes persulcatus]|uniref:Uncharacterized protein n=1 Tax=Ixodes persulcatus TaxID=34615 RepID=A0AC60QAG1_IXOPE|nr:hypothetical protein HPB47_022155 [Ixodes persulcatus]
MARGLHRLCCDGGPGRRTARLGRPGRSCAPCAGEKGLAPRHSLPKVWGLSPKQRVTVDPPAVTAPRTTSPAALRGSTARGSPTPASVTAVSGASSVTPSALVGGRRGLLPDTESRLLDADTCSTNLGSSLDRRGMTGRWSAAMLGRHATTRSVRETAIDVRCASL